MASNNVTFTWNTPHVNAVRREMVRGLLKMGADIASKARFNAPVLTGALRNSIRTTTASNDSVYVLAGGQVGGKVVDYALVREYSNRKHPNTTHYMGRAFETVVRGDITHYFRGEVR